MKRTDYTPEELAEALQRLNMWQQARNLYTAITPAHVRREASRTRANQHKTQTPRVYRA